jgi:hypothetical protein
VLITEYFEQIESRIADCVNVLETNLIKDKRSLHIGIIEGEIIFTDESALHFVEFVNVKESPEIYKYSYHYQDRDGNLIFRPGTRDQGSGISTFDILYSKSELYRQNRLLIL